MVTRKAASRLKRHRIAVGRGTRPQESEANDDTSDDHEVGGRAGRDRAGRENRDDLRQFLGDAYSSEEEKDEEDCEEDEREENEDESGSECVERAGESVYE
ncbi:uncharacterized protein IUM83_13106 [Phytophthora cinnamomi]|uniref:uncharacterized protein n=1 Tax=Phytophthora cinnamomi TaxID=4785 RepID=UPI00355976E3|nr:hypothetical protein IUM83_13106 [Phytophthora cinnamomi]